MLDRDYLVKPDLQKTKRCGNHTCGMEVKTGLECYLVIFACSMQPKFALHHHPHAVGAGCSFQANIGWGIGSGSGRLNMASLDSC